MSRKRSVAARIAVYVVLLIVSVFVLMPLVWAISASLKPLYQVFEYPVRWIPERPTLENYVRGWQAANFSRYFLNSILVTVVTTLSVLFFSVVTGFALTKFRFPGRRVLFVAVIATLIIPIQVRAVPLYLIVRSLGWINTYWALIVPALITSVGIFMMSQFIKYMPDELIQAARIDGCSEPTILARIVIPLSRPGLAALAIMNYMAVWNDFFWPLLVIDRDSMRTLPLGMTQFTGEYFTEYGQFFAIALVAILPMVVVFLLFQKQFIQSAAMSGIKG